MKIIIESVNTALICTICTICDEELETGPEVLDRITKIWSDIKHTFFV